MSCRWKKKEKVGFFISNFENYTRYFWVGYEEQKIILGIFIKNYETYTRYFELVADEERKNKILSVLRGKFNF